MIKINESIIDNNELINHQSIIETMNQSINHSLITMNQSLKTINQSLITMNQ